jgi:hypothetical protein
MACAANRAVNATAALALIGGIAWATGELLSAQSSGRTGANAGDPCAGARVSLKGARNQVQLDEAAIRNMGFAIRAQEFDDLLDQTKESQIETQQHVLAAAQTLLFTGAEEAIETPGKYNPASLNPWNVNTTIGELSQKGLLTDAIERDLRWIARQNQKREVMLAGLKGLEVSIDTAKLPFEQKLEATKDALGWFLGPGGALITAASDYSIALVFAAHAKFVTQPEIDRLASLTDSDLKELSRLSTLLKTHVEALRELRTEYDECLKVNPVGVSTTLGKQGFRVHWTDYPAESGEARPLILDFIFVPADGRRVEVDSAEVSDGGKSGGPLPGGYVLRDGSPAWPPESFFVDAPPGEYAISVRASKAYCPLPWGNLEGDGYKYPPSHIIDQPPGPILEFHATVQRGKTTDLFPRYRRVIPPPKSWVSSHIYDPKNGTLRGYGDPISVNEQFLQMVNRNRSSDEPPLQIHEWTSQDVYLGFGAFREVAPACPIDGRKF